MRIQVTIPGEPNEETLGIALEAATRLAQHDLALGQIPPIEDAIKGGIRWQEEPPGQESFDKPSTVLARGWGDCDDLAPWLAAEMRETDFDPGASAIAIPSGHNTWHAIVQGSDGEEYDPSEWAGMSHSIGGSGVGRCACCKPLNVGKPALGIGSRSVRVDMPGLRATRGCIIGVSHQADCDANDESRVYALVAAIEDAIATAQLARTGDKRAIKQLAVIYRVLRGDDLHAACNGVGIRPDQVGMNFDSSTVRTWIQKAREILASTCDEAFAGDTWMANNGRIVPARKTVIGRGFGYGSVRAHRMGFVPCLAPIAPLVAAATTVGTWAAIVGPLALALQKMAGENTDFGRAMGEIMKVTDKVKLVSAVSAGIGGLIEDGIPAAFAAGSSRWVELLQSPLAAAGASPQSVQQVADTMHWVEKNAASVVPPDLATKLTPQVLDFVAQSQKFAKFIDDPNTPLKDVKGYVQKASDELKKAFELVRKETRAWLESIKNDPNALPPNFSGDDLDKLAESKAGVFFNALANAPPPPAPGIHAPRTVQHEGGPVDYGGRTPARVVADAYLAKYGPDDPRTIAKMQAAEISELPPLPPAVQQDGPTPGEADAISFVSRNIAATIEKENLHPPPPHDMPMPQGWDDIFASGCLQQTDFCT